jgi:peptidoglycan/LPS O-acetylase OafA/YrhL
MFDTRRDIGPDLLRAVAILLVMSWHIPKAGLPEGMLAISKFGWFGVDIFFVLSGFLIGSEIFRQVRKHGSVDLKTFYAKRALRILPAFLVVLAVYALVPGLRESRNLAPIWRFLTFTVNFGLDYRITGAFTHAWSLCVEEQYYLLLPLIAPVLWRIRSRWMIAGLVFVILIGGMSLRAVIWHHWNLTDGDTASLLRDLYYPTYTRLDGLLMGVLLAALSIFRPVQWQRYADFWLTFPAAVGCLAVSGCLNLEGGITLSNLSAPILYPLFTLGIALLLSSFLRVEKQLQLFRWTGAGFIAEISYSLYLSHKIVMHIVKETVPIPWRTGWAVVALHYAASIAVATLLFFAIERTFLLLRPRILAFLSRGNA